MNEKLVMSESEVRFRELLKTLFQFDAGDLDFGIYRIMNYRRKEIGAFIEKDLVEAVEKEFQQFVTQSREELLAKIADKKKEIEEFEKKLGEPILKNGEVREEFRERPLAREYLELKKQLESTQVTENAQSQVFNDLYTFFARYYEDGDFISKRRYSSRDTRYAIPYNGEEVKLYWANFDQYYVKTGEVFKDYEFNANNWRVVFKTAFAEVETGNARGERRYFVLAPSDAIKVDKESKTCLIQFQYKQLTDEDLSKYKVLTKTGEEKKTAIQQDELNGILCNQILEKANNIELEAALREVVKVKEVEKTVLEKQLYKYTRKITSDFFIHKNLKGFLERELDYFIKTEVLDIHNLDPRHVTRARVVENIGKRIIEFLSQIEDFQKLLWEKKKFVLRTDYVITTDRVPEELMEEVLACEAQLKEWADLGFGKISTKKDLNSKKLPVDTKHFGESFKERLLEKLSEQGNLDDLIDGLLIKSENWQALSLLLGKYKEKVKCIYIDPPYNTGSDEFIYKDKYQHSSWLAMMADRLELARTFMSQDGISFVSIDDHEQSGLKTLMEQIFGVSNFIASLPVIMNLKGNQDEFGFAGTHEYVECAVKDKSRVHIGQFDLADHELEEWQEDEYGYFKRGANLKATGVNAPRWKRQNLFYPIYVSKAGEIYVERTSEDDIELLPITDGMEMSWRWEKNKVRKEAHELIVVRDNDSVTIYKKQRPTIGDLPSRKPKSVLYKPEYSSGNGTAQIKQLFGFKAYNNPKPVGLIFDYLLIGTDVDSLILDFFIGSGTTAHAVINLNRRDGGRRKYMLVDIEDSFDTVMMPRLKKIIFTDKWKNGKPQGGEGTSQIIKYHYLEQYEDTLHNIEFPNEKKGQMVLKLFPEEASQYIMKYMLRYETEGSPSLLNVKQFENPFEYKLKMISHGREEAVVAVDLVETFNYLLGLKIDRYKFLNENGRKYVIVLGERGSRRTAVIWRPTKDLALQNDKELIEDAIKDFSPNEIFVNGDAMVKGYKVIESEFKALMGV